MGGVNKIDLALFAAAMFFFISIGLGGWPLLVLAVLGGVVAFNNSRDWLGIAFGLVVGVLGASGMPGDAVRTLMGLLPGGSI